MYDEVESKEYQYEVWRQNNEISWQVKTKKLQSVCGRNRKNRRYWIDLTESIKPDYVIDGNPAYTAINFPKRIKISKEYGNTVYDVVADFSTEGKDTVLKQFKKLILSDQNWPL